MANCCCLKYIKVVTVHQVPTFAGCLKCVQFHTVHVSAFGSIKSYSKSYYCRTFQEVPPTLMHQSLSSPRVGGQAYPGHLIVFPFPWVENNKRFPIRKDPEGGGV